MKGNLRIHYFMRKTSNVVGFSNSLRNTKHEEGEVL